MIPHPAFSTRVMAFLNLIAKPILQQMFVNASQKQMGLQMQLMEVIRNGVRGQVVQLTVE